MGDRYVGHYGGSNSRAVSTQGGQQQQQQWTSRMKNEDKSTGSYERYTTKEKVSTGQQFVERSTGRVGYKDEAQRSSTVKIGNKSGYTEVHTEQKVKTVTYDNNPGCNNTGYATIGTGYATVGTGYATSAYNDSGYSNNVYYDSDEYDDYY